MFTLDHIIPIKIEKTDFRNEVTALNSKMMGIGYLYETTLNLESQLIAKKSDKHIASFGFDTDMPPEIQLLLPNLFHWFTISVSNYVRLVGYIEGVQLGKYPNDPHQIQEKKLHNDVKKQCDEYSKSIPELQDVLVYRNKVAAHYALTDPRKDNPATLINSTMYPISFEWDRFHVGGMQFIKGNKDKSHVSELPHFSLTKVYEQLQPRFWPKKNTANKT